MKFFQNLKKWEVFKSKEIRIQKYENNFKNLHTQSVFWRRNNKYALCWAFYFVNDNKEVNGIAPQTMRYIICHNNLILNVNPKTQTRTRLIIYNTTNSIIPLRKHVNSNLSNFFKSLKKKLIIL